MQEVNINEITDLDKLKSMAYDQIANKEMAQKNLDQINARILSLIQEPTPKEEQPARVPNGFPERNSEPTGVEAGDETTTTTTQTPTNADVAQA